MKKDKKKYGPVAALISLTAFVSILSLILHIIGAKTNVASISNGTVELSLISVKSIFSKAGLTYLLSNTIINFRLIEPLVLFIISLMVISMLEYSGLIRHIVEPFKKIKPSILTFLIILVGSIFTLFGDYSYVILIPFVGVIYKYLNRNPVYGIIAVFIGIATGYGTGIIYDYNYYSMGLITEKAASIEVDKSYAFNLLSNCYIMLASTLIVSLLATSIVIKKIGKLNTKYEVEEEYETSDKGLLVVTIINLFFILLTVYGIIPGLFNSGFLLDLDQTNYVAKLFSPNAPFKEGILIIVLVASLVSGYVYGKLSGNIKNFADVDSAIRKNFDGIGYLFVLFFFATVLYEIVDWTNLSTFVVAGIVAGISKLQFSGILLVIVFFVAVLLMSFIIPDTLTKWNMISPLIVPLFMKSNITPEFTQFLFAIADGIGRSISPFYIYFIVLIGFIQKYNKNEKTGIVNTIRKVFPTVILVAGLWLLLIVVWYIIGLPLGLGSSIIM